MNKEIKIIRKQQHKTSTWSGGTTTQLYIYPKESQYDKRDFLFRISSAKVEVDESLFTNLPGINREIMIIDGDLELQHEGHYNVKLSKFDKDRFRGDWTTKSYGKVTDFNLMMNKDCDGSLKHIEIDKVSNTIITLDKDKKYGKQANILYCASGEVEIVLEENIKLYEGDLLLFMGDINNSLDNVNICNYLHKKSHLIISNIGFM